jgi:hypothetical protein
MAQFENCIPSAAKAAIKTGLLSQRLKRCATQKQEQSRAFRQTSLEFSPQRIRSQNFTYASESAKKAMVATTKITSCMLDLLRSVVRTARARNRAGADREAAFVIC